MAAGQLAGGLSWLAISGEDAPDLVATAPVSAGRIVRAKIEAVMGGIAIVFLPFIAALAWLSPFHAVIAGIGIIVAAASAIQIDRKSTRLNSSHSSISYAVFCLKKK